MCLPIDYNLRVAPRGQGPYRGRTQSVPVGLAAARPPARHPGFSSFLHGSWAFLRARLSYLLRWPHGPTHGPSSGGLPKLLPRTPDPLLRADCGEGQERGQGNVPVTAVPARGKVVYHEYCLEWPAQGDNKKQTGFRWVFSPHLNSLSTMRHIAARATAIAPTFGR